MALLGAWLTGCAGSGQTDPPLLPESMKGYELYSWQDGDQWKFSLLTGTNREKTLGEIKSPGTALTGVDLLIPTLEKLSTGQYVTWVAKDGLPFPPDDMIARIETTCEENGLILNILK